MSFRRLRLLLLLILCAAYAPAANAQADASQLYSRLRDRVFSVKDYVADVVLHIDVSFMRVPQLRGKLYYKNPGKLKLVRQGGLSILPRRTINLSLAGLLPAGNATVIDAGKETVEGRVVRVLKVVPESDASDIVLTKLWVDEARLLILRTETTTRDNGTVAMSLKFGRQEAMALPDEMTLFLDVKEYKMPRGMTMDYDPDAQPVKPADPNAKRKKGKIRIEYLKYDVNVGLSDAVFADDKKVK